MHFDHEKLIVYQRAIQFAGWTEEFLSPLDCRAVARDHLARASDSIPTNLAQGNAKRSLRGRVFCLDNARGSALECGACLDVLVAKGNVSTPNVDCGKGLLREVVSMLMGLRKRKPGMVQETGATYDSRGRRRTCLDHERLDVYQTGVRFVSWNSGFEESASLSADVRLKLDRASTGVVLNIAEGNGRFSHKDRVRFIDIANTHALQCASSLDTLVARKRISEAEAGSGKGILKELVNLLMGWRSSLTAPQQYGDPQED